MGNEYSAETKAETLAILKFHKGNCKKTAEVCGLDRKTVAVWAAEDEKKRRNKVYSIAKKSKEREIKGILDEKLREALAHAGELLPDANINQTISYIETIGKYLRLFEGESTENIDVNFLTPEQKEARVQEIMRRAKERKDKK